MTAGAVSRERYLIGKKYGGQDMGVDAVLAPGGLALYCLL